MKIAVSAGHYAAAQGAAYQDLTEWAEAKKWQALILQHLGPAGIAVSHTNLSRKIAEINQQALNCAVEIHFNSDGKRAGRGSETLFSPYSRRGQSLADSVQKIISPICTPNRGIKAGWYRMDKPGHVDYAGDVEGDEVVDAFLQKTKCPAIIVEPFFIHEASKIEANREVVCELIAQALIEWCKGSQ